MDEKINNTFKQIQRFCVPKGINETSTVVFVVMILFGTTPGVLTIINRDKNNIVMSIVFFFVMVFGAFITSFLFIDMATFRYKKALKKIKEDGAMEIVADDFRTGKYLAEGELVAGQNYFFIRGKGIISEYDELDSIGVRQIVRVDEYNRETNTDRYFEIEISKSHYDLCPDRLNVASSLVFKELKKVLLEIKPDIKVFEEARIEKVYPSQG